MKRISELTEAFKSDFKKQYGNQILTIPFESFVLNPWSYMKNIESALKSKITHRTKRIMKKQKVPRDKISDGIPLKTYKRCGWEPPEKGLDEKQELGKRRQYAIEKGASKEAMEVLDRICQEYEKKYF